MIELFECIHRLQHVLISSIAPMVRELGFSRTDAVILISIHRNNGLKTTDLARMADVPASTFTGLIDRLVEKGFINRVNDETDRRSILLTGTPKLRRTIKEITGIIDKKIAELIKPVPESLIDATINNLKEIYEYLVKNSV